MQKVCPICGVLLDAEVWRMDSCPCCESKQESAPWITREVQCL